MILSQKQISLRGAGCIRLRVGFVALTREPDTVSTVGGKDAHMRYPEYRIAPRRIAMRYIFFMEVSRMQTKTKRLTESAMLMALAVVLEIAGRTVIPPMPFGGQLTLVSMLPIVLISYRHGVRWGLTAGLGYGLIQMALGADTVTAAFQPGYFGDGTLIGKALIMCLFDYILAYMALGQGGCFRDRVRRGGLSLMLGSLAALGSRYLAHIVSGYVLFAGWAEWFFTQDGFPAWGAALVEGLSADMLGLVYSVVYNGMYMIPEMVLTAAAALLVARIPRIVVKES